MLALTAAGEQTPAERAAAPSAQTPPSRNPVLSEETGEYVLQVGDELFVKVFGHADLTDTVKVGPDGRISTMFFNNVRVEGRTVEQVRVEMTSAYATYLRDPKVALGVKSHANLRVLVGGEVERPGVVPFAGNLTVLTALLQAGGLKATAKSDSVVLVRNNGKDQPVFTLLNVRNMLNGKTADVALQTYDVVYVPMTKIAKFDRFVDQYLRQTLPVHLTAGFTYLTSPGAAVLRFQ